MSEGFKCVCAFGHGGNVLTAVKLAGELLIRRAIRNSYEREALSFQAVTIVSACIAAQIKAVLSSSYKVCPFLYNENYKKEMQSIFFALKATESCPY